MKRGIVYLAALFVAGVLSSGASLAEDVIPVNVQVSPSTIVLGLDYGSAVTVHTDIAFGIVDRGSVQLSGVSAFLTKADSRGNLVAKFSQEAIEAIVAPPAAILVLTGATNDGIRFEGADTVSVIEEPSQAMIHLANAECEMIGADRRLLAVPTISEIEASYIIYMRQEEKLARDVYLAMYDLWGLRIFDNISQAEQRHLDAIKELIDYYGLQDPVVDDAPGVFADPFFADLYAQLITQGSGSVLGAVTTGALIEEMDIVDLRLALEDVTASNVVTVFEHLESASCNHLRAFVRWVESLDAVYTPLFLTQAEFDEIVDTGVSVPQGHMRRLQTGESALVGPGGR